MENNTTNTILFIESIDDKFFDVIQNASNEMAQLIQENLGGNLKINILNKKIQKHLFKNIE